jgi:hypothetical protein
MKNVSLEFQELLGGAGDANVEVEHDAFAKFQQDAELAGALNVRGAHQHVTNLRAEAAPVNTAVANHYKKLAAEAELKTATDDPQKLEKRAGRKVVFGKADDPRVATETDVAKFTGSSLVAEMDADGRIFRITEVAE